MHKICTVVCAFVLIPALSSCGSISSTPKPPTPQDPSFGTVGNALVKDGPTDQDGLQDYLWVGFDSSQSWQNLLEHSRTSNRFIIGGKIIATSVTTLGFYVDPHTSVAADGGIPECFTTIDAIKSDLAKYTDPGNPGWCIQIEFVRVK